MVQNIEFETPENVQVSYNVAGLGSRFVAWIIDVLLVFTILFVLFIVVIAVSQLGTRLADDIGKVAEKTAAGKEPEFPMYIYAVFVALSGFSNLLYYGLSELLMRGQTVGKRVLNLRVVKANGFSLDASAIFLRNVFRVIDHFPILWLVPFLSKRSQRLGDMLGGTLVVKDEVVKMSALREQLLAQPAGDVMFHFPAMALQKLRPTDTEAVERFLERSAALNSDTRSKLLTSLCDPLAKRLEVEPPDPMQRMRFLQELLTAELRRQYRQLG